MKFERFAPMGMRASMLDKPADAQAFAEAMMAVQGVDARDLLEGSSGASSPLQGIAQALAGNREATAGRLTDAVRGHDNTGLLMVARDLQDQSVQGDLFAKVAGKTVSAIDQLTKLT